MPQDIVIKKSKISGLGVFANRNFRKGEVVLKWRMSKILTKPQADKLSKKLKNYIFRICRNKYVLQQSPERYVNHSCIANTYVRGTCDIASRNIKKGEEITSNYTPEAIHVSFKCRCGKKNCRRLIYYK